MTDDMFEMPDMDEIQDSLKDAMEEAQKAMDNLPGQLAGLENVMGSLSDLMGDLPTQLEDLSGAVGGFEESHQDNLENLVGEPDWELQANIKVGNILDVVVLGQIDIAKTRQTWESTQGDGFDSLVKGVIGDTADDLDEDTMGQVLGQLKMGRGMARIEKIQVRSCSIAGAPGSAADELKLSPEGNIPVSVEDGRLSLEFAPMLTIQNRWENASLPTFTPMASEIQVPLADFDQSEGFSKSFQVTSQDHPLQIQIRFRPL